MISVIMRLASRCRWRTTFIARRRGITCQHAGGAVDGASDACRHRSHGPRLFFARPHEDSRCDRSHGPRRHCVFLARSNRIGRPGCQRVLDFRSSPYPQIRPAVLEVTAIDVGQGDSILLASPSGRTLLVDTGGLPRWIHSELEIGEDVVSPNPWSRSISQLDALAITHTHADHMGGAAAILANFRPRELWLGDLSDPEMTPLLRQAAEPVVHVVHHQARDSFDFGGAEVRVLAPDGGDTAGHRNDESLVMKFVYRKSFHSAGRGCGTKIGATILRGAAASGLAQSGAPRQHDFHDSAAARSGTSSLCVDFREGSQYLWPYPGRRSGPAGCSPRPDLAD
jgi:hypothetical protein